jgi:hypothetical protein
MKVGEIKKQISDKFYDHMDIRGGVSALVARKVCEETVIEALTTYRQELITEIEGMKTLAVNGKTYHDTHPDVVRNETLDKVLLKLKKEDA